MPDNSKELLQKFNRTSAHLTVLHDQLEKKTTELEELREKQARQDKAARVLSEMILRKEQDVRTEEEKKKGAKGEAPWFSFSTVMLIEKAQESYEKAFEKASKEKKEFVKQYSEKIDALKKIIRDDQALFKDLEERLARAEKEKAELEKNRKPGTESGDPGKKPENVQKNALGHTQVRGAVMDEDEIALRMEDAGRLQAKENEDKKNGKKSKGDSFPVTQGARIVLDEKEKAEERKEAGKAKKDDREIKEALEVMTENERKVLLCIGEHGFSEVNDVIAALNGQMSGAKARTCINDLGEKAFLKGATLNLPLTPRKKVFWMSGKGRELFRFLAGKDPLECRAEKIKKEHTSLEHGYSILEVTNLINGSGYVKKNQAEASCIRDRKQIKVAGGKAFVPDITISTKEKDLMYIEYETTKCTEADFIDKCDKFVQVSDDLNFIVPGLNEVGTLKSHAEKWLEIAKGKKIFGRPVTIRVATLRGFKESCSRDEFAWEWEKRINASKRQ